jgi:CubicO group peptidase (beta-lactamase class C family)
MTLAPLRMLVGVVVSLSLSACAFAESRTPAIADVLAPLGGAERPGCVAGVYREGALVDSAASGTADLTKRIPLTTRTVFNIGSVSKQFTAFAVLLLEHRGALSLDDSVTKHIPELGEPARAVTLQHLLNHTGGLRDYIALLQLSGHSFAERTTREQALDALARQRAVNSPPGIAYDYSNSGYFLLGVVVERVSGRSLREFLRKEAFEPLGMTSTFIVDRYPAEVPALARGYSPAQGSGFEVDESTWEQTGDGQVHTSIEDLARWERNFLTGKVGGSELLRRMVAPGVLASGQGIDYAAGLSLWSYRGLPTISHGGDWAGYAAHYLRFPAQHYAFAVLCNRSDAQPSTFTSAIAERYLASKMSGDFQPRGLALLRARGGGVHPSLLPAGLYRNDDTAAYLRLSFEVSGPQLQRGTVMSPVQEAVPGVFHVRELGRNYAVFTRSADKHSAQVVLQDSPQPYVYEFVQPWSPANLDAYAGTYVSSEAPARFALVARDGTLFLQMGSTDLPLRPMAEREFEGLGLLGDDAPFTLRFDENVRGSGLLLFVEGLRGLRFAREN